MKLFDKILKFSFVIIVFLLVALVFVVFLGFIVYALSLGMHDLYMNGYYISFFVLLPFLLLLYAFVIRVIIDVFKKRPDFEITDGIQSLFKNTIKDTYEELKNEIKNK